MARDDDEERRKLEADRKRLRPVDRLYGKVPRRTMAGDLSGHARRRKGRIIPALFRMTLRTRAIMAALRERDDIPSDPVFLELLIEAYLEKYRDPPITIPSDLELIEQYEKEQEIRDGR